MTIFNCRYTKHNVYIIRNLGLPPSRPQWNGGVERGNRIFREEFYARKDIKAESLCSLRSELKIAVHKYNSYRPHNSLNGLTPLEYIQSILKVAT
ncbi:MAG: hypothetical protein B7Y25_03170 [Alphaproteobacteria bacterium 16-39-46]|nr:MAG: hypothetical protein B7Y25_03170 [Alphaproteobacteria bacterium 16-39-46]OZA43798.1 MAG: hypothetical protein B7X84_02105 [Alphaproteobacteria bacterium 17-39-52]HQS83708.1 integrase core domain-containing protein [Alphaproteobacteria bacterium]HQS93489.1 integrase core domain-containing protein [Alphaproteobacteria bacterium]